jgi:transcriptional regulator with XRE-family HTH domain
VENIEVRFTKQLQHFRKEVLKMTQAEAAEVIGISLRYYQQLEKGDSWPSPQTLQMIMIKFNVSASDLFDQPKANKITNQNLILALADLQKEIDSLRSNPLVAVAERLSHSQATQIAQALSGDLDQTSEPRKSRTQGHRKLKS